jgi:hypothetical protein
VAGEVDTGFFDRHHERLCAPRGGEAALRLHAAAAALAGPGAGRSSFRGPAGERVEVLCRTGPAGVVAGVEVDGVALAGLRVGAGRTDAVDLEVDGVRRLVRLSRAGTVVDVDSVLGHTELVVLDP